MIIQCDVDIALFLREATINSLTSFLGLLCNQSATGHQSVNNHVLSPELNTNLAWFLTAHNKGLPSNLAILYEHQVLIFDKFRCSLYFVEIFSELVEFVAVTVSQENLYLKYAFQYDAYRLLQWSPLDVRGRVSI